MYKIKKVGNKSGVFSEISGAMTITPLGLFQEARVLETTNLREACVAYGKAYRQFMDQGRIEEACRAILQKGKLHIELEESHSAMAALSKARSAAQTSGKIPNLLREISILAEGVKKKLEGKQDDATKRRTKSPDRFDDVPTDPITQTQLNLKVEAEIAGADEEREKGHFAIALSKYERAAAAFRKIGNYYGVIRAWLGKSECHLAMGEFEKAESACNEASECLTFIKNDIKTQKQIVDAFDRIQRKKVTGQKEKPFGLPLPAPKRSPELLDTLNTGRIYKRAAETKDDERLKKIWSQLPAEIQRQRMYVVLRAIQSAQGDLYQKIKGNLPDALFEEFREISLKLLKPLSIDFT